MSDWYLYILYSSKIDKFYIGHTSDLSLRLSRHNAGWGKYTKRGIPWEIVNQKPQPAIWQAEAGKYPGGLSIKLSAGVAVPDYNFRANANYR
jgi:putative endonuclease